MSSSFPNITLIADKVFEHIEKRIRESENKELSDEDLLILHSVFGSDFQRAIDILEKHPVVETYITSNKKRVLIEIKGENGQCYRVFPNINYCPCLAFKHQVIDKRSQITCKHVIVGRICTILGKTVAREVTQEQYLMLVQTMFEI